MAQFLSSSRYKLNQGPGDSVVGSTRKPQYGTRYYLHVAKESDTFDLLALQVLGDPSLWWKIADLNPHVPFPSVIPAGTTIRLPRA